MAIEYRNVTLAPLSNFTSMIPDGSIVGIIGDRQSGGHELLSLAAGTKTPESGEVSADGPVRLIGTTDPLSLGPVKTLVIEHALSLQDALVRGRAMVALSRMRQTGACILVGSHEIALLRAVCTEIWWMRDGRMVASGEPGEVLEWYSHHVTQKLTAWGAALNPPVENKVWVY
jgi:lipopolysaccharide transport system ATP-binding protein